MITLRCAARRVSSVKRLDAHGLLFGRASRALGQHEHSACSIWRMEIGSSIRRLSGDAASGKGANKNSGINATMFCS